MTRLTPSAGHATGLPGLTRRSLLSASPALLAPVTLAPGTTELFSPPADPHASLLAAFHRATAAWLAVSRDEEAPEARALWDERTRLERLIEETVARTPAGIAAQIEYAKAEYGNGLIELTPATHFDLPAAFLDAILAGVRGLGAWAT